MLRSFVRTSRPALIFAVFGLVFLPSLAHAWTFPPDETASKNLYRRLQNDYQGNPVFRNAEINRYRDGKLSAYLSSSDKFKTQSDPVPADVMKVLPDGQWISYALFNQAIRGMRSVLKNFPSQGIRSDVLTIADFSQKTESRRLIVLDLQHERVLFQTWVHHARRSDLNHDRFPEAFSNINNSNQSSAGFILTDTTPYIGQWGYSLRLHGIDGSLNSLMHSRAMIMHPWPNIHPRELSKLDPVSQSSLGCLSLPYYESGKFYDREDAPLSKLIIDTVKGRSVVFSATPQVDLEKKSIYLNSTVAIPTPKKKSILARLNSETNRSMDFAPTSPETLPAGYEDWKPRD